MDFRKLFVNVFGTTPLFNAKFVIADIPQTSNNSYTRGTCINTYYQGFSGGQSQHSFFVDAMIPMMVGILNDIKDSLITPLENDQLINPTNGGAILYEPVGNPPSISDVQIPWNWIDYFTYLSYVGLQNSNAYSIIFPPNSNIDFIRNQYISAGETILNP